MSVQINNCRMHTIAAHPSSNKGLGLRCSELPPAARNHADTMCSTCLRPCLVPQRWNVGCWRSGETNVVVNICPLRLKPKGQQWTKQPQSKAKTETTQPHPHDLPTRYMVTLKYYSMESLHVVICCHSLHLFASHCGQQAQPVPHNAVSCPQHFHEGLTAMISNVLPTISLNGSHISAGVLMLYEVVFFSPTSRQRHRADSSSHVITIHHAISHISSQSIPITLIYSDIILFYHMSPSHYYEHHITSFNIYQPSSNHFARHGCCCGRGVFWGWGGAGCMVYRLRAMDPGKWMAQSCPCSLQSLVYDWPCMQSQKTNGIKMYQEIVKICKNIGMIWNSS